jgi:hypothetical protein
MPSADNWIPVSERLPEQREKPYQVIALCVKRYKEMCYAGEPIRGIYQDWVLRNWPQNYSHWMPFPRAARRAMGVSVNYWAVEFLVNPSGRRELWHLDVNTIRYRLTTTSAPNFGTATPRNDRPARHGPSRSAWKGSHETQQYPWRASGCAAPPRALDRGA